MSTLPRSLRVFAVAFALLAISNWSKTLGLDPEHGLVFLGRRLHGTANLIAGPMLGTYLGIYAWGLWHTRSYALPMGILYAGWVPLNIYLFTVRSPEELGTNSLFGVTYTMVAVGVSLGAVIAMMRSSSAPGRGRAQSAMSSRTTMK